MLSTTSSLMGGLAAHQVGTSLTVLQRVGASQQSDAKSALTKQSRVSIDVSVAFAYWCSLWMRNIGSTLTQTLAMQTK
eukprot:COSAG03_NODE_583_length_6860_cov_9.293300_3_plen_78_part_00